MRKCGSCALEGEEINDCIFYDCPNRIKDKRKFNGGNKNAGRKSREELGLPPVINTTVQVEKDVIDKCREKHGSLANALRYAAKKKPNQQKHILV